MFKLFKGRLRKPGVRRGKRQQKRWLPLVNKILISAIILSGVWFVITVNDLSIKGFVINELKLELRELKAVNEELSIAVMELESFEQIEERAQELKMVKVDTIEYIEVGSGAVAAR